MDFKIRFTCCGPLVPIAPPAAERATSEGPGRPDQALSVRSRSGNELPEVQPRALAQSERSRTMRMIKKFCSKPSNVSERMRETPLRPIPSGRRLLPAVRDTQERRRATTSGPVNVDRTAHAAVSGVRMANYLTNEALLLRLDGNLKSLNAFAAHLDTIMEALNSLASDSGNNQYQVLREMTEAAKERKSTPLRSLSTGLGGLVQLNTDRAKLDNVTLPVDALIALRAEASKIYHTSIPLGISSNDDPKYIPPKLLLFQLGDRSAYDGASPKLPRKLIEIQRSTIEDAMTRAVALRDGLAKEYQILKTLHAAEGAGLSDSGAGPSGLQNSQDATRRSQAADRPAMKNGPHTVLQPGTRLFENIERPFAASGSGLLGGKSAAPKATPSLSEAHRPLAPRLQAAATTPAVKQGSDSASHLSQIQIPSSTLLTDEEILTLLNQ